MPTFQSLDLLKWLLGVALATGGGGAMAALLLSGLEEDREDLNGLAAALWKLLVRWAFRVALLLGVLVAAMQLQATGKPATLRPWLLEGGMSLLLILASEAAPKALAARKRGAPLLVLALFLCTTFVAMNFGAWH
jgi:heme/copper-type cytochrome/quinol oxidase subunit 3